jgi:hypothetical protein
MSFQPNVLVSLIQEATDFLEFDCSKGRHAWVTDGARACPRESKDNRDEDTQLTDLSLKLECSQSVYKCRICGEEDYGEPGGPGYRDCFARSNLCSERLFNKSREQ